MAAGATGYLQKETNRERLLETVRGVFRGELRVPAEVVRREREILVSFAQGMSYPQIAKERGIKSVTVRNAVYSIQHKLQVGSMQGLVVWAVRNGLLDDYAAEDATDGEG